MIKEMITSKMFAEKLKIGRSTLFEWLGKGILLPGKHYFKHGRILRFAWCDEVIHHLMEKTESIAADRAVSPQEADSKKAVKPGKQKPAINLEY